MTLDPDPLDVQEPDDACSACGAVFPSARALAAHRRLGRRCQSSLVERFWRFVDRSGGPAACWPWLGTRTTKGYGNISFRTRPRGAHRVALEQKIGRALVRGEMALHHCDNPPCCNPDHLYAGDAADNGRDKVARGHTHPKLVGDQVVEVLRRHREGESARSLGRHFRVSASTIGRYLGLSK